jgi:hypothetical protein
MRMPTKEQQIAYYEVAKAIAKGTLAPAAGHPCASCGRPARELHHANGYDQAHILDVTPLCVRCHRKSHAPELVGRAPRQYAVRGRPRPESRLWSLRVVRERRDLTLTRLCRLTGIPPGALASFELGVSEPLPETVMLLASALGVRPNALRRPTKGTKRQERRAHGGSDGD